MMVNVPQYVIEALADVRDYGSVNMLDRRGVTALTDGEAQEWLEHASNSEYMEALNQMGARVSRSDDGDEDDDFGEYSPHGDYSADPRDFEV